VVKVTWESGIRNRKGIKKVRELEKRRGRQNQLACMYKVFIQCQKETVWEGVEFPWTRNEKE